MTWPGDPERMVVEVEIKITGRLRKHGKDPKFVALSERLEALRLKHEQGLTDLVYIILLSDNLNYPKVLSQEMAPQESMLWLMDTDSLYR